MQVLSVWDEPRRINDQTDLAGVGRWELNEILEDFKRHGYRINKTLDELLVEIDEELDALEANARRAMSERGDPAMRAEMEGTRNSGGASAERVMGPAIPGSAVFSSSIPIRRLKKSLHDDIGAQSGGDEKFMDRLIRWGRIVYGVKHGVAAAKNAGPAALVE